MASLETLFLSSKTPRRKIFVTVFESPPADTVDRLKAHLDQVDDTGSIKFTHELEVDNSIPFLDTKITKRPDGTTKMVVYRKKTHTGQYPNFQSHHPFHQKLGVIRTLMDRAHSIVTEEADLKAEEDYIQSSLRKCGYPGWSFKKAKKKRGDNQTKKNSLTKPTNQRRKLVTIPCVKGTSEALQRIYQKYHISTAFRPHKKLRNILVHPKDKRSIDDQAGVVYQIPCGNCERSYIGETARKFGTRKNEHKLEVDTVSASYYTRGKKKEPTSHMHKSAINGHVASENHHINWKKCSILARDSGKTSRWIREAIHIRKQQGRTFNRDLGQYSLSSIYDPILSDRRAPATSACGKSFSQRSI
ncbi:uncharacterized protein [Diadema setosum]|uniref:uncharacterized protein n=1 Tax=Diadema setosum TaxID=31175 RepID=UPI003B3A2D6D